MDERARLLRRGLTLEHLTLAWNVVGAVVAIAAAFVADSVALAGFGIDSLIEIGASVVVIWHLRGLHERTQKVALRLIAISFLGLAIYIFAQCTFAVLLGIHPSVSFIGMAWLAITFVVMLALAAGKDLTGARLHNQVLLAEARVTLVDAALAGSVLVGLALNAVLGWWWADTLGGALIVFYAFAEARHAWLEANAA